jgi:hypothetical protein
VLAAGMIYITKIEMSEEKVAIKAESLRYYYLMLRAETQCGNLGVGWKWITDFELFNEY